MQRDQRTEQVINLLVTGRWGALTVDELASEWHASTRTVLEVRAEALRYIRLATLGTTLEEVRHHVLLQLDRAAQAAWQRRRHWAWLREDGEVVTHSEAEPDVGGVIKATEAIAHLTGLRVKTLRDARRVELAAKSREELAGELSQVKQRRNGHAGEVH